ncbi:MAG: glycosyltransferase family 2 protein [Flavobacterium sp.]|uniref:glycosyltransferase family 2 protein n=1 Tax=Flavobacterium sp. TaxID=239 RepID=UPI002733BFA4|nr:glycosyltransferase family 2 protein [Flavobacterium sp.]MDP3679652.1 glycosyltransferase family 2 protein [Flavobacterium sp.]MDZ4330233.1 glycosyltransferase family 2 protein [Flavobacterium sp.]
MNNKISVIIPCYNQALFLEETLQSVLNQTHSNWECIIVNDGSSDNTEEVALAWCEKDSRFTYLYKENGGLSSARNAGIAVSNGEYIQLLDSDDLIVKEKFELQILDLQESQIAVSNYFSFQDGNIEIMAENRYLSPFLSENDFKNEIISDWEYLKSIPCHSVLFKKALLDKHDIRFDESLPNHEDWVFWVMLFYFSDTIKNNKQVLALYRIRTHSMSVDYKLMKIGFLKAAQKLERFFHIQKNTALKKQVKKKYKEIYNKGRRSTVNRLKSKIYLLKSYCRNYVRKN